MMRTPESCLWSPTAGTRDVGSSRVSGATSAPRVDLRPSPRAPRVTWGSCHLGVVQGRTAVLDPMEQAGCCPGQDAHAAEAVVLGNLALDPALEACCRRDLEERAEVARLKAALSLQDRSTARQQLQQQVVGRPPVVVPSGCDLDENGEDDVLLDQLRARRLAQLQEEARQKAELQARGLGTLAEVSEVGLLEAVERSDEPVVAHLAAEGVEAGDVLDEYLSSLAHHHLATRFLRTLISLKSTLHLRLGTPPGPGLVCFREGSVIAAASLDCFGGLNGIMEEAVAKWMREQQVLHTPESLQLWAAAQRQGRPRQAAGSAGSNSDEGGSDWQEPCDVCGRCYPHQHIRSMYGQHYSDSDSDND